MTDKPNEMPAEIWAIADPWGEWADSEEYAKHKSSVNCCDAPFTRYVRADLVEKMREALEFYAKEEHYFGKITQVEGGQRMDWEIYKDGGTIAREALKGNE